MGKQKSKKKKEHFNDLLLPILAVLCIMPFIIYLKEYDFEYSSYVWHSDNSVAQDLYSYYRSYFFLSICGFAVCILPFRMGLYKEKNRPWKIFLPLALYVGFVVLSTIFSVNTSASLKGNYYQFQSMFVLAGYVLLAFYTYQILETERDYRTLFVGILVMFGLMVVIGGFQLAKHDLLNFTWMQRLIMSAEDYEFYGGELGDVFSGNNVFLSLYNPNYAGIFLTMFFGLFLVLTVLEQNRRKKIALGIATLAAAVLIWFTYSRSTLLSIFVSVLVLGAILGEERVKKGIRIFLPVVAGLVVLLLVWDGTHGFKYLSRMVENSEDVSKLQEMTTGDDGVTITYDDVTLRVCLENGELAVYDADGNAAKVEQSQDGEVTLPFSNPVYCMAITMEEKPTIEMYMDEVSLTFVQQDGTYYFRNDAGKTDTIEKIDHVDFHGLEYLGSGRLYIWSRTIPLLKKYLLVGSGPDTFAEVFPQDDYAGKLVYAHLTSRIMEKAHNDFLMNWVQTGLGSLICLLVFYGLFLRKCIGGYRRSQKQMMQQANQLSYKMGLGCLIGCVCYLVSCLFNDSTLYTTPVFWIFAGIALAAITKNSEQSMRD